MEPNRLADDPSRDRLTLLVEHQAALRRVATLVAQGVNPAEVFAAVAEEMRRCLDTLTSALYRFDSDGEVTVVAASVDPRMPKRAVGERMTIEGDNLAAMVLSTGKPARQDSLERAAGSIAARVRTLGVRAAVGVPIVVNGQLWGLATVASDAEPLPLNTEQRVTDFAELVATAIANAATRDELQASRDGSKALAEQQAALRRVATLVARGASPPEVFAAVTDEMRRFLQASTAGLWRYEATGEVTLVASATEEPAMVAKMPVGTRTPTDGNTLASTVRGTGRPARVDDYDDATGLLAARIRDLGVRAAVGAPVIVDGKLWGLASVGSVETGPMPADTEARIGDFAELVATAVANAATRDELIASRARIVAAADDARRRLERDLHDGAQQRLVSLSLKLCLAEQLALPEQPALKGYLSEAVSDLSDVLHDLQEFSRGIHPAILSEGGLAPALRTLARRCPVSANVDVRVQRRLPDSVEVAAYYVVAEALTNAAKYSQASKVNVCAEVKEGNLCLSVDDDGIGGADSRNGSGLIGLKDRVEVLGGQMKIISPPANGTSLHVTIPLSGAVMGPRGKARENSP